MKYKCIDCNYYDVLEAYATLRRELKLEYLNDKGELVIEETRIKDFRTKNKEEFAILATGTVVRLDRFEKITPIEK